MITSDDHELNDKILGQLIIQTQVSYLLKSLNLVSLLFELLYSVTRLSFFHFPLKPST